MCHLQMVSEKNIKMLKTSFVATQIEVLQVAPQKLVMHYQLILQTCKNIRVRFGTCIAVQQTCDRIGFS